MSTNAPKNGAPSANGRNGNGTFAKGNNGGPGNPQLKALAGYRMAWAKAVKTKHVTEAYAWLHEAWSGDEYPPAVRLQAFREFMDRTVGKVHETVEITGDQTLTIDLLREGIDQLGKRFDHRSIGLS